MVGIRWAFTHETIKSSRGEAWRTIEPRSIQLRVEPVWHRVDDMCGLGQPCGLLDSWGRVHILNVTHTDIFFRRPAVFRKRLEDRGHVGMELERFIVLDRHVVDQQFSAIKIKDPEEDVS